MDIIQKIGALLVAGCAGVALTAQAPVTGQQALPLDPVRERGVGIMPAFEGWYANADGTFSLLIGYFNRNTKEALDIPVGPNNRVEPGPPDQGQPTHFLTRRQAGVFTVQVPADFGKKRIIWT